MQGIQTLGGPECSHFIRIGGQEGNILPETSPKVLAFAAFPLL
jgi:hypothetical protein